jgi:hypothetical protein
MSRTEHRKSQSKYIPNYEALYYDIIAPISTLCYTLLGDLCVLKFCGLNFSETKLNVYNTEIYMAGASQRPRKKKILDSCYWVTAS